MYTLPMMPTAEAGRDPNELHERARRLLAAGDAAAACGLLEQVVTLAPHYLPYWLSLAAALRTLGRHAAELNALERALALDSTHLVVLLQKGALLDLMHPTFMLFPYLRNYARALSTHGGGACECPASGYSGTRAHGFFLDFGGAHQDSAAHRRNQHAGDGTFAADRASALRISSRRRDTRVAGRHRLGIRRYDRA